MTESPEPPKQTLPAAGSTEAWWRNAVFYQVYVRSFADSTGDGVGDLPGITSRLDYLAELGIDALWLTPFYRSPMIDHGYDVADPRDVDPVFGDLAAFDALLAAAHERGIRVTVDVVPNHVSTAHPWFVEALTAHKGSPARDRFFFRDGRGAHGELPPNNWVSGFGGSAWQRVTEPDGRPGQWYLHLFAAEQPDLNWENPAIAADLQRTLRFWLDRGVDGFRIDVAHGMAKPNGLPDTPPGWADRKDKADPRPIMDNDHVHTIHRMIRRILNEYPERMAVGEVWVGNDERRRRYVRSDELHLAFDFALAEVTWAEPELRRAIASGLHSVTGTPAPPCWVLSNHDVIRHVTRYGGGELGARRGRAAALIELALPGVAYIYQGDELSLPNVELPDSVLQDPVWERSGHTERGRDGCRVPLPWSGEQPPFGFSPPSVATWLPQPAEWGQLTVDRQENDPQSTLNLYRAALRLRHESPAIRGAFLWLDAPPSCLAFGRESGLRCLVNFGQQPVPLPPGEVLLTSSPLVDGALPADTAVWLGE